MFKHKKALSVVMAVLLMLSLLAACGGSTPQSNTSTAPASTGSSGGTQTADAGPIKIGVIQDITGPTGTQGQGSADGIKYLCDKLNAAGGINGRQVELVVYDCVCDVEESINCYKRAVEQDKVSAVCGPPIANIELALGPIAESYKVPIVAGMIDENCVIPNGQLMNYLFMCQTSAGDQGTILAKYADEELNAHNVGVLYDLSNAYSVALADPFIKYYQDKGYEVHVESFTSSDSNYLTQLNKLKGFNPEVLYFPVYPAQVTLSVTQAREVGMDVPIIGSVSFIPNILDVEVAYDGSVYFPYALDPAREDVVAFDKEFEELYGYPTNTQVFIAMESFRFITAAIEKCGSDDPTAIKDAIEGIQIEGWAGTLTMDPDDHMMEEGRLSILNVIDGKANCVKSTSIDE